MSAPDAQNMFSVDPNTLVEQYRKKLSDEVHRALLLENALQTVNTDRERLVKENEALKEELSRLIPKAKSKLAKGQEAVNGSVISASSAD